MGTGAGNDVFSYTVWTTEIGARRLGVLGGGIYECRSSVPHVYRPWKAH